MTAIATVLALLRLARLTPYLLAILAALAACLLLGTQTAFAGERSTSHAAKAHEGAAAAREVERAHETQPAEEAAPPARQQPARVDRPTVPPPVLARVSDPPAHRQPPAERAPVPAVPVAANTQREIGPDAGRPAPPVTTLPATAAPPVTTLSTRAQPQHLDRLPDRPVQVLSAAGPQTAPQVTTPRGAGDLAATPTHHTPGVLLAHPGQQQKAGSEQPDPDDSASGRQPQSKEDEEPAAARPTTAPAAAPSAAPQPTPQSACLPPAEEDRKQSAAHTQVHRASVKESATGLARRSKPSFARPFPLPGIALVAAPAEAVAPILALAPPAIALPAPDSVLPNPPTPIQPSPQSPAGSALPAVHQAALTGNPLVVRLQSAVTVGALWLLVPLLAVVLLFQVRLMRQMRSLTAPPAQPVTRYYSLTHQEARELAPDMVPALAHHRFCETERHRGRWRPASWLELEETDSEPLLMWATCETCHHQRMTRLRSGQEVAVSHS